MFDIIWKKVGIFFLLTGCMSLLTCSHSSSDNEISFRVKRVNIDHFTEIGRIEKVICPEPSFDSYFSLVDRVRIDEAGHLYILDTDSHPNLYHFDPAGKFLNNFGQRGQGPGEFNDLLGFDIDPEGFVYLLTNHKLIKFTRQGEFVLEKKIQFFGRDIRVVGNEVYIFISMDLRNGLNNENSIFMYDSNLNFLKGIGTYDSRLIKYRLWPRSFLDGDESRLFFLDIYDLCFRMYDTNTGKSTAFKFPNDNKDLDAIWNRKGMTEDDRTTIKNRLHSFGNIFTYNDGLYLEEFRKQPQISNFWLVDLKSENIRIFPREKLIRYSAEGAERLYFNYAAGSYENGVILIIHDRERFHRFKDRYPEFNGIKFDEDSNPLIIFLNLTDRGTG